ncbi:MAG: MFS transporter, partial [Comamonas sp.]
MTSMNPSIGLTQQDYENSETLAYADTDEDVTPGEIAVGVIIGRSSEYFDFFVFGIACVLVFPT